jgi:putative thioredoxin
MAGDGRSPPQAAGADRMGEENVEKTSDIMDVSQATFQAEVVEHSASQPVVVDFWAPWCAPCRTLGPTLERLTKEAKGAFRLAKLNVDDSPEIAMRYDVQGIPAVKAFRDGRVVAEFVGAQAEPAVRQFLKKVAPDKGDQFLANAGAMLGAHRWAEAETGYQQILAGNPANGPAALGLLKALLAQGKSADAERLLGSFPNGREAGDAERLRPLARYLVEAERGPDCPDAQNLDAEYCRAGKRIASGDLQGAMDAILTVLRRDKRFRQDEPRLVMLGIFEVLGDQDPLTRDYRSRLASVLF